jgi:hypothetical protein
MGFGLAEVCLSKMSLDICMLESKPIYTYSLTEGSISNVRG